MSGPDARQRNAELFDALAPTYDDVGVAFFRPIAAGLAEALALASGERVADLGCGKGAFLFPAARAVGATGRVVGIDISSGMASAAQATATALRLAHVEIAVGDAQAPALGANSFDVAASSLVLFFLPDPAAALAAWRELLVSGGRLGVATFGPPDEHFQAIDELLRPFVPQEMFEARARAARGPFGSDAAMEALVGAAGFADVRTRGLALPVRFADAAQWFAFSWSTGQRLMWERVPPAERPATMAAAERVLAAAADPTGGYLLRQQVRYTLATRP